MVSAKTPTLAKIKNRISLTDARALLSLAICEVCDFFNVGKNMNEAQIAATADLIIDTYWYMRLEEIKFCFHRAMRREKLFDRLDGNIILRWLRDYDAERTEEAINASHRESLQAESSVTPSEGGITWEQYLDRIKDLAAQGDATAIERVEQIQSCPTVVRSVSKEEAHNHELDFKKYFYNQYLKGEK